VQTHFLNPETEIAMTKPTPPNIGQVWPEQGSIYAGLSRGEDGAPDAHLVLLDDVPDGTLNWKDATAWAEGLGDGARLPTRFEAALLYAHVRDQIEPGDWYWTSTQYSDNVAWIQGFGYGIQDTLSKLNTCRARAVRRLIL
jgi:hypothetical protein